MSIVNLKSWSTPASGDTIVEVMIAIAIIGIALGAGFVLSTHSFHTGQNVGERAEALALAQGQVEFLKNTYFNGNTANLISKYGSGQTFCYSDTDGVDHSTVEVASPCLGANRTPVSIYDISITYCGQVACGTPNVFTIRTSWAGAGDARQDNVSLYYKLAN